MNPNPERLGENPGFYTLNLLNKSKVDKTIPIQNPKPAVLKWATLEILFSENYQQLF